MASSSSKTQQTQTQVTQTSNLNLQDIGGPAVLGDGNTVITTDLGAISAAGELARYASQSASDVSAEAATLGREALRTGADLGARGFDAASEAFRNGMSFASDVSSSAFDATTRTTERAFDFGSSALDANERVQSGAFDLARDLFADLVRSNQDVVTQNLTGLGSLAKQTSASSDDRVTKVAGYAMAAVAAALVLPALFKGN